MRIRDIIGALALSPGDQGKRIEDKLTGLEMNSYEFDRAED